MDYYNFNIVKTRVDDSSLGYLGINGGQIYPEFNPNIKEYSVMVHSSFEQITIGASTSDYRATLSGIGEKNINFGNNKFTITVTAEDGDITAKIKATPMQWPITSIGTYDISYYIEDSFGESVTKQGKLKVIDRIISIREAIGKDRYDTAVKLSQLKHSKTDIAVIVNGTALADGLAVTPLATYYNAPILLTTVNSLPKNTVDELKRLKAKKVIIAGGKGVVSDKVESQLRALGVTNIERLSGSNRYHTNSIILRRFYGKNLNTVYVAKGSTLVDALAAGATAALDNGPVMLVPNQYLTEHQYEMLNEKIGSGIVRAGGGTPNDMIELIKYHLIY